MTQKQQLGNFLWIAIFCAALTSPFWGQWTFGLGVILMAVIAELRKDAPAPKSSGIRTGPRLAQRPAPLREANAEDRTPVRS